MVINHGKIPNGFQSVLVILAIIQQILFKSLPTAHEVGYVGEGGNCYESIRFVLILMYCPMIYDEGNRMSFIKLTNLIVGLRGEQKECLARWMGAMGGERLGWIVGWVQRSLTGEILKLLPENMDKNDMKSVTHFLDIFCCFLSILSRR